MKRAAVFGGAGFIGIHLCARLAKEGYEVVAYDRKRPEFGWEPASSYHIVNLCDNGFIPAFVEQQFDEVYQLAAEMGGAGFVFDGKNDSIIMVRSVLINLNTANAVIQTQQRGKNPKVFFASSACVYSSINTQRIARVPNIRSPETIVTANGCREDEGINPDSDYGLEKLFAEKLYDAHHRNYGLDIRIGRLHNVFGPYGTWRGGREKAPAALCRKIADLPKSGGEIEIWGSGQQTRSFLYVDEAVEAVIRLMRSDYRLPVNIGSSECVSIDKMAKMIADYACRDITLKHVPGPTGVDGRNSDNTLIEYVLGWKPTRTLKSGLMHTYDWIKKEVDKAAAGS